MPYHRKASFFAAIQGVVRAAWRLSTITVLLFFGMANLAADDPDVVSPPVSYVFLDSLEEPPPHPNIVSPLVSYLFHDWIGDENVTFTSSDPVSYLKEGGMAAPTVTGISPQVIPGIEGRQWVTLRGTDFAAGAQVYLFDGVSSFLVPPDRLILRSDSEIRIFANFTTVPSQWTVQVVNPGGFASSPLPFNVNPTMVRPLESMDFGTITPGEQSLRTFTVRNSENSPVSVSAFVMELLPGPFTVLGGPFADLAPGAEQQVVISYTSGSPGSHSSKVVFKLGDVSTTRSLTGRTANMLATGTRVVSGRVVQNVGGVKVPVADSLVQLLRLVEGRRVATGHDRRTGPTGEFSMDQVAGGAYLLVAHPPARAKFLMEASRPVELPEVATLDFELELPTSEGRNPTSPENIPVVLVRGRGTAGNDEKGYWAALRGRLRPEFLNVWDPNEFWNPNDSFFPPINGQSGIISNAKKLREYIVNQAAFYELQYGVPPPRIHLVAHSMGGLIVRQMLHDDRTERKLPPVGDVFMLSTPNSGTLMADYVAPATDWFQDWQSNRDLRTEHVRRTFAPTVTWPNSGDSEPGIRLFLAGGTRAGGWLYNAGSAVIRLHSPPGGRENDGAVPLLSSRGHWLAYRSLLLTDLTMFTSFEVPGYALAPQSVPLNHTEIKQDDVMLDWIEGILRGRLPGPISTPMGEELESPPEVRSTMSESLDVTPEQMDSAATVDFRSFTISPAASKIHEVPLETVSQADFVVSYSEPAVAVHLIEPGGAVIDATASAGNPAITFETFTAEEGGMVNVSISDPVPGLWQVVMAGENVAVDAKVLIQVSCESDLRLVPGYPERIGSSAPLSLTAKVIEDEGDNLALVPGGVVTVMMTDPEGQGLTLSLSDDGSQGDDATNDGTHGLNVANPGSPGDYELLYVAEGVHPTTGEAFRRFARGGFTRAAPDGFVAEVLSHTAVDSDDNGYPETVMLVARVEVDAAGDYALSGRLLSEGHQEAITAVADFSTEDAGTAAVTLLFTPYVLPEGKDIGPFALDELLLFRRGEDTALLDVYAGDYEVPVTLHNEVSRVIRLSGDLNFGEVEVGQTAERTLTIHNDSWATLGVGDLALPPGFSAAFAGRVDPGDAVDVEVTFTPTKRKAYQGDLTVASDALAGAAALPLAGAGVIPGAVTFAEWIATAGAPLGQDGPNDDPTGKGIPNLLAFWLNLPPGSSDAADYEAAMPKLERNGSSLTFTFRRNRNAYGILGVLEASPSLAPASWQEVAPDSAEEIGTDPVTGDPIIRLTVPNGGGERRFLRLRVKFEEE